MAKRFVSIWFRYLTTDWFSIRDPRLRRVPFVLRTSVHGRMIITAANAMAEHHGAAKGTVLADARAIIPNLEVLDDNPELPSKLLRRLAEWCIRFTPVVAVDLPDGLFLEATGCSHLWGGDSRYLETIVRKLKIRGYETRIGMADTPGVAWAVARYGGEPVVKTGEHRDALLSLPPDALRLESETLERLHKLGLHQIQQFIHMPRPSLRRRFGQDFIRQLDRALGYEIELIDAVQPIEAYVERLPCMEPIVTAIGIEIALKQLLQTLCTRLQQEQKGLRKAVFKGYRVDGKIEQIDIGTNRAANNPGHLFRLFSLKLGSITPGLGIELFTVEAQQVEDHIPGQEKLWESSGGLEDMRLSELIDRMAARLGVQSIKRYLPEEHYWPERSFKSASSLCEGLNAAWKSDKPRPLYLLPKPELIEVTAPIPDYPPMLFRRKGKLHKIITADGPERIEQEWWLQQGQHRDYYRVEDEQGNRYWLFRLGHYHDKTYKWFLHGFFG